MSTPEGPSCGEGLAENSSLPAKRGEVIVSMVEILEAHMKALVLTDQNSRQEYKAYESLVKSYLKGRENMGQKFIAKAGTTINAPASKVWDALTNPAMIKQYLYGTEVTSDWQVGSPITYRGEWEGKTYEDKGKILQMESEKLLVSTFWSSLSGLPDTPENYRNIRYELSGTDGQTQVIIIQDNNATEEEAQHSQQNWLSVLSKLKELLEK